MKDEFEFRHRRTGGMFHARQVGEWCKVTWGNDLAHYYTLFDADRFIRQGVWQILEKPAPQVTCTLYFDLRDRKENPFFFNAAKRQDDGYWLVEWTNGNVCYYSNDQVQGFIASGEWVVGKVEESSDLKEKAESLYKYDDDF